MTSPPLLARETLYMLGICASYVERIQNFHMSMRNKLSGVHKSVRNKSHKLGT